MVESHQSASTEIPCYRCIHKTNITDRSIGSTKQACVHGNRIGDRQVADGVAKAVEGGT